MLSIARMLTAIVILIMLGWHSTAMEQTKSQSAPVTCVPVATSQLANCQPRTAGKCVKICATRVKGVCIKWKLVCSGDGGVRG
jgi:hypothetical protein